MYLTMRQKIVAGNWKMHKNREETKVLISELKALENTSGSRVIIAPSYVSLAFAVKEINNEAAIDVAAQNMDQHSSGAYTGEVSASMLKSVGVKTVILGHSERRIYFGETDTLLKQKVNSAVEQGMEIIFCIGENLKQRESGTYFHVISSQISNVLFHLEAKDVKNIILAYEPVWAIGTGKTATPGQVQEMHAFIREMISWQYNEMVANSVTILYGGSCKPANAVELFSNKDVDGGLIGGASLNAEDFYAIVNANR